MPANIGPLVDELAAFGGDARAIAGVGGVQAGGHARQEIFAEARCGGDDQAEAFADRGDRGGEVLGRVFAERGVVQVSTLAAP